MEDFNVKYYAHHAKFLLCLFNNYDKVADLSPCQKEFEKVSKEVLLRDFASRLFYTAFLKAREELSIPGAMHETVQGQLDPKYERMFKEMKKLRVNADYKPDAEFSPLLFSENVVKHYPFRLLTIMENFLKATGEQLAKNHVTLEENRARNK